MKAIDLNSVSFECLISAAATNIIYVPQRCACYGISEVSDHGFWEYSRTTIQFGYGAYPVSHGGVGRPSPLYVSVSLTGRFPTEHDNLAPRNRVQHRLNTKPQTVKEHVRIKQYDLTHSLRIVLREPAWLKACTKRKSSRKESSSSYPRGKKDGWRIGNESASRTSAKQSNTWTSCSHVC